MTRPSPRERRAAVKGQPGGTGRKRAATTRQPAVYVFEANGWDLFDRRDYTPDDGTLVVKTQPFGAPRNGTMGHCYVADLDGNFLGLVSQGSLRRATRAEREAR